MASPSTATQKLSFIFFTPAHTLIMNMSPLPYLALAFVLSSPIWGQDGNSDFPELEYENMNIEEANLIEVENQSSLSLQHSKRVAKKSTKNTNEKNRSFTKNHQVQTQFFGGEKQQPEMTDEGSTPYSSLASQEENWQVSQGELVSGSAPLFR